MNEIQKIFSNALFRVMATWFGFYIQDKVAASILEPVQQAQQIADQTIAQAQGIADQTIAQAQGIADQTIAQAQGIADSFTIRNVGTQDNVEGIVNAFARHPGTGETEHERLVTQQWPGDEAATQHTVYDSIMYIGGEEVTV